MAKKHPDKEIRNAVKYATENGWTVTLSHGHPWGILRCPYNDDDCRNGLYCQFSVWSTPKNPTDLAKKIKRVVDNCSGESKEEKKGKDNEDG